MDLWFIRNRRVAAQAPQRLIDRRLAHAWFVAGRDDYVGGEYAGPCEGAPTIYASEATSLEVSTDPGGWVIVNTGGNYLRTSGAFSGDRRRIRRFKTAAAAAAFAERLVGDFPRKPRSI